MRSPAPPRSWPYLDHPGPIPFAHRGGALELPENTMAAFAHAVGLGYRYVETDVHTTSDGVVIAFHDDILDRVTDRTGRISELPWSEVQKARVGRDPGEPVPTLDELLGTWPQLRVNIDAKHDASVEPLIDIVERTASHDRVCIGAFSDPRIRRIRALTRGKVCTSMSPWEIARLRVSSFGVRFGAFAAGCAQVPVYQGRIKVLDERFVAAAHRKGIPVHVWTIDEEREMERLLDLGVDGIMSDRTTVLKDVLVRRGQWH